MNPIRTLAFLVLALLAVGGCSSQTPAQKLYLARQSYIGTEQAVTALIRAGVIKPGPTLDAVEATRNEARAALEAADAAEGQLNFGFYVARLQSALGRFAQFYLDHKPAKSGEPGASLWLTPLRSSPASPRLRPSFSARATPTPSSRADKTSPPRNRTLCARFSPRRTQTLTTL